jgi:diguanylate cyclase (GGDEF)-like protein
MQTDNNIDANNARINLIYKGYLKAILLHPILGLLVYFLFKDAFTVNTSFIAQIGYAAAFVSLFVLVHALFLVRFKNMDTMSKLPAWERYFAIIMGVFGCCYASIFSYISISLDASIYVTLTLLLCCALSVVNFLFSASRLVYSVFTAPIVLSVSACFALTQTTQAYAVSATLLSFSGIIGFLSYRSFSIVMQGLIAKQETKQLHSKVAILEAKISGLVTTDKATGLNSRAFFDTNFSLEYRRAKRNATNLSVLIAEIDCFAEYEKEHGGPQTAKTYRAVATTLKSITKRAGESVSIYNNRAFVFLLPGVEKEDANKFAKMIQKTTLSLSILNKHSKIPGLQYISVSVGVSEFLSDAVISREDLLEYAEKSLTPAHITGAIDVNKPDHWFTFGNKAPVIE